MYPTPPGNSDGCETKGLAEKGICKVMKTKGGSDRVALTKLQTGRKKRGCMLLISKGRVAGAYPTPHFLAKEAASD